MTRTIDVDEFHALLEQAMREAREERDRERGGKPLTDAISQRWFWGIERGLMRAKVLSERLVDDE